MRSSYRCRQAQVQGPMHRRMHVSAQSPGSQSDKEQERTLQPAVARHGVPASEEGKAHA